MKTMCAIVASAMLAFVGLVRAQAPRTEPVTAAPRGAYAVARLEISAGLQDAGDKREAPPQKLYIALRDGRLASLWFVRSIAGDSRLMVERSTLALKGDALTGQVELRTAPNRGSAQVSVSLTLNLKVSGDRIAGQYELISDKPPYKPAKGTATGTFATEAALQDALAAEAAWPSFWGPRGDMSTQPQPPLLENFAEARPVWRSETYVPTGFGNAPDSRYFTRAMVSGNGGGGSSPVIAQGTLYMYFFQPSPQSEPALKGNPYWQQNFKDDADFRAKMAEKNATEREVGQVLNHFRPLADDHIVAIDAATGAERWRTVLPLRSPNHQTHKHRGTFGVPLVAGDTLFVANHMSRLYALDAKTGKLKWEKPAFAPMTKEPSVNPPPIPSPMLIGDNLIFAHGSWFSGGVIAYDPATGLEKWKAPGAYAMRWTSGGKERVITLGGLDKRRLICVDAADGKILWEQETTLMAVAPLSAVVSGDMLIAAPAAPKGGPNAMSYEGWKLSDSGATRLWQDPALMADENMPVTVTDGKAYLLGKQVIRVLEVASGKQVAERKFEQHGPGSNAWLGVVGDRLLLSPEGQHGTAWLIFMDKDLKDLAPLWLPSHVDTTAYNSQPIVYPIVDGRIFIRGGDGIYCYDLRKK